MPFTSSSQPLISNFSPIAFATGDFSVRWYALMYLVGFAAVMGALFLRTRKKEGGVRFGDIWDVGSVVFLGGILGGRVGYAVLYGGGIHSIADLFGTFFPWDIQTGVWTGWYGMSFFGAIVGAVMIALIVCRLKKLSFLGMADFVAPAIPLGILFGRIGNFFNGELWGRETDSVFGVMVDGIMRHPSQFYEAGLEGMLLFFVLWSIRNKKFFPGAHLAFLGIGYGVARFVAEFFREESVYAWGLTQGQVYACVLILIGDGFLWWQWRKYGKMRLQSS